MARGDTSPPRRAHFDDEVDEAAQMKRAPQRVTYQCRAHGCPMPGTVDGCCGWHYRESPQDWHRITEAIQRWSIVANAINVARGVLCAQATCCDGKVQRETRDALWHDIKADFTVTHGWQRRIDPEGRNLGDWCVALERFLAARIKSDLIGHDVDETKPTPTVAEFRSQLRAEPLKGNAGDWL